MPAKHAKQQREELAAQEEAELLKAKMDAAGLSYVEQDLPDDGLQVSKGIIYSLRSLWPGTDEYYEAQQAEMEMDDLSRLRIERVKAADLVALASTDYEEALEQLMSATENDFFFFNKLKYSMEQEGKWEFEPKKDSIFGASNDAEQRRNRIRRAFRAPMPTSESYNTSASMSGISNPNAANLQDAVDSESKLCSWKGKNKAGEFIQCSNMRMNSSDVPGSTSKQIFTCAYHVKECIEQSHDHPVTIRTPNTMALCTDCYLTKSNGVKLPNNMTMETCPGVTAVSMQTIMSGPEEKISADIVTRTAASICEWHPGKRDLKLRGWTCSNCVYKHPETGAYLETCGMHIKKCLRQHNETGSSEVTVPNKYGLCVMHHTAEHGEPPKEIQFPFPGMKYKKSRAQWAAENHHWAAPKFPYSAKIDAAEYEPLEEPEDFIQQIIRAGQIAKFKLNKRKKGAWAATKCQSYWRRYRYLSIHTFALTLDVIRLARIEATIKIQRQIRRYLSTKFVVKMRKERTHAAVYVQSHYRGYLVRKKLRLLRAGRKVHKFTKKLRFFKFRDTIIMTIQLRKLFKRRYNAAVEIQKYMRGKLTRLSFFYVKLNFFITNRAAKAITIWLREVIRKRMRKREKFIYPTDTWAKMQCEKKLAHLVWRMMQPSLERQRLAKAFQKYAVPIQKVIRGFIGRSGAKQMRCVQRDTRAWLELKHANYFLSQFYESHLFSSEKPKSAPVEKPKPKELNVLRKLLPMKYQGDLEVDTLVFNDIISQYYESRATPLLTSELDAIKINFANPASRRVNLVSLEAYIFMHDLPCRKHGRLICGACHYTGKCMKPNCSCCEYQSSAGPGSICEVCFHPPDMHQRCPLQCREATAPSSMLSIMNHVRQPDTSIPSSLEGTPIEGIVVPPPSKDERKMSQIRESDESGRNVYHNTATARMTTLGSKLSFLEEKGKLVATIEEYWNQRHTDMLHKQNPSTITATANVESNVLSPRGRVTMQQFWDNASRIPSKSMRDYDEKFDHNIPVSIVDGTILAHTFEGSLIYLNLLNEFVKLEYDIGHDSPKFLRLIVDNIQIFERHWRKMVADIRKGELNRLAHVDETQRTLYSALSLPRPGLAAKLDNAFRKLGFHKKALGKDVQTVAYAEKKVLPKPDREIQLRGRRPSLPMTPSGVGKDLRDVELVLGLAANLKRSGAILNHSGSYNAATPILATRASREGRSRSPSRGLRGASPPIRSSSAQFELTSPRRALSPLASPTKSPSRQGKNRTSTTPDFGSQDKTGLLLMAGEAMKEGPRALSQQEEHMRVRGPSRRGLGSRRGSETDIVRHATPAELQKMNYEQVTEPRLGEHLVIGGANLEKFICPFPACGMSFKTAALAFKHIPIHEQRIRLKAPTATTDSHLRAYWPDSMPWLVSKKFTTEILPPGAHCCDCEGCKQVFASRKELIQHKKAHHAAGKTER